ncbi:MAG TPA: HAMP domain-containing sensor histidine kinase, partial [Gemmatales bacterium]|nr:HAMP domain-containing sensor histidine kinase [Gemmatales bacterium]
LTVHPPGSNLPAPPPFSPAAAGVLRDSLRLGLALADRGPWLEPAWATPLEDEAEALRAQLAAVARQTEAERRSERLAALAEFAAGASHEINNPLAVISAQAQHLLRDEESPERVAGLRRIVAQCQRIHRVLRDVMLYARPPQPQAQAIRLEQVTKDVVRKLAELARERGVTLELGPGLRQRLLADAELIDLALTCLVQNGIEAAPKSGWVRISAAEPAEGLIAITVADSGSGLAPALLESCFDPLFSGRQAGRGLGMGLSKVWRIAQLHDGTIHVRSEPGQPTEFVLTLPLRPARGRTTLPGRAAARRNRDGRQQSKARPAGQPRPASVRKSVSRRRAAARRRR